MGREYRVAILTIMLGLSGCHGGTLHDVTRRTSRSTNIAPIPLRDHGAPQTRPDPITEHLGDDRYIQTFLDQFDAGILPKDLRPAIENELDLINDYIRRNGKSKETERLLAIGEGALAQNTIPDSMFFFNVANLETGFFERYFTIPSQMKEISIPKYSIPFFADLSIAQMNKMPIDMLMKVVGRTTLDSKEYDRIKTSSALFALHDFAHGQFIRKKYEETLKWYNNIGATGEVNPREFIENGYRRLIRQTEAISDAETKEYVHALIFYHRHELPTFRTELLLYRVANKDKYMILVDTMAPVDIIKTLVLNRPIHQDKVETAKNFLTVFYQQEAQLLAATFMKNPVEILNAVAIANGSAQIGVAHKEIERYVNMVLSRDAWEKLKAEDAAKKISNSALYMMWTFGYEGR